MEAVPRMPMLCFSLKHSPEYVEFGPVLKKIIREQYSEDPALYNKACNDLEHMRQVAVSVPRDFTGCSTLKRYYAQLQFLQSRFKLGQDDEDAIPFTWEDVHTGREYVYQDIKFEQACILYNIGALHSILGAADTRTTAEGMKVSCTHFQCAAWAFEYLRDYYTAYSQDLSREMMSFHVNLMLAQAQECILEKSMSDSRKSTITAKVAAEIVEYYKLALKNAAIVYDQGILGSSLYKAWKRRMECKMLFYQCIKYFYLGQQADDQQKWGERVTYFSTAHDRLTECMKLSKADDMQEPLQFTYDVVVGKYDSAKKDNDFIYHEKVPDLECLPEVKGASLVKGIPFNPNDPEISGPDIFQKLVPIEAHEAASLYSEEKAKISRKLTGMIEEKNEELEHFLTSLQLEKSILEPEASRLPQDLLERCAAISARPNAIKDLVDVMGKLSGFATEVEMGIKEVKELIEKEIKAEEEFEKTFGKRPPMTILNQIQKDCELYESGHARGSKSNKDLHKAMNAHVANLKLISGPLEDIQNSLPNYDSIKNPEEEAVQKELKKLLAKVDEMKSQRVMLEEQFRTKLQEDDITNVLVTQEANKQEIFEEQLKKHDKTINLIEQNLAAQENILRALTNANAKFANTRKTITEIRVKRETLIKELMNSYDVYEDLLAKSHKGLEFYTKLGSSIEQMLRRTRSVCQVQEEERGQIKNKYNSKTSTPSRPAAPKPGSNVQSSLPSFEGPKLKDYLPYMKPATFGKGAKGQTDSHSSGSSTPDGSVSLPDLTAASVVLHHEGDGGSSGALPAGVGGSISQGTQSADTQQFIVTAVPFKIPSSADTGAISVPSSGTPVEMSRTLPLTGPSYVAQEQQESRQCKPQLLPPPQQRQQHTTNTVSAVATPIASPTMDVQAYSHVLPSTAGVNSTFNRQQGISVSANVQDPANFPNTSRVQAGGPQYYHSQDVQQSQQYSASTSVPSALPQSAHLVHYPNQQQIPATNYQAAPAGHIDSMYPDLYSYQQVYCQNVSEQHQRQQIPYSMPPSTAATHPQPQIYSSQSPSQHPYGDRFSVSQPGYSSPSRTTPNQQSHMPGPPTQQPVYGQMVAQQQYPSSTRVAPYQIPSAQPISASQGQVPTQRWNPNMDPTHSPSHTQYQMPNASQQHPSAASSMSYIHSAGSYGVTSPAVGQNQPMPWASPSKLAAGSGHPSGQYMSNVPLQHVSQPQQPQQPAHMNYPPGSTSQYGQQHPTFTGHHPPQGQPQPPPQPQAQPQLPPQHPPQAQPQLPPQAQPQLQPQLHPQAQPLQHIPTAQPSAMSSSAGLQPPGLPPQIPNQWKQNQPQAPSQQTWIPNQSYGGLSHQQVIGQPQPGQIISSRFQSPAVPQSSPQHTYNQTPSQEMTANQQILAGSSHQTPYSQSYSVQAAKPTILDHSQQMATARMPSPVQQNQATQQQLQSGTSQIQPPSTQSSFQQQQNTMGVMQSHPNQGMTGVSTVQPQQQQQDPNFQQKLSTNVAPLSQQHLPGMTTQVPPLQQQQMQPGITPSHPQQIVAQQGVLPRQPTQQSNPNMLQNQSQQQITSGTSQGHLQPAHTQQVTSGQQQSNLQQMATSSVQGPSSQQQSGNQILSDVSAGHLQQPLSQYTPPSSTIITSADLNVTIQPQFTTVQNSNIQTSGPGQPSPQHTFKQSVTTSQSQPATQVSSHILNPPKLSRQWSGSTVSSLDDILSSSPENVRETTIADIVLTPKVLTPQEIQQQKEEAIKNNAMKLAQKQDPYQDKETLDKFVIEVEKFEKVVQGLSKPTLNGPSPLDSIWKELCDEQEKDSRKRSMAAARCDAMKNRDPDIMPYDDSRVLLTSQKDDYINASWLDELVLSCPKFIATQFPLNVTIVDFWIMVYEQGAEVIVKLFSEAEEGKKYPNYWPTEKGQIIFHGPIGLTLQTCKEKEFWTERLIYLTHSETKQARTIVHLQYRNWPVSGFPEKIPYLLQFIAEVHSFYRQQRSLTKPVIVHCSNGVGRTGTFISVYAGVEEVNHANGILDIQALCQKMMKKRRYIIRDKEQLKYCYDTILYHAEDLLMKRGILTNKASFGDKLPNPGDKTHQRKPSEDLTKINVSSAQTETSKDSKVTSSKSEETNSEVDSGKVVDSTSSNLPDLVQQQCNLNTSDATGEAQVESRSRSGSGSSSKSIGTAGGSSGTTSMSNSPQHIGSSQQKDIPLSLAQLQNPNTFTLELTAGRKKITKSSFTNKTTSITDSMNDPDDPLSSLDPLWSIKKKEDS
ncbi:tyrosine-protein phosphatase non-receptor type 23 isoform X2 [Octopus sinensis]|uniref:Tyrosine-protein phosphatase non-receptor type 23 isoform X2 n=1 Tax=Octopus sinensis TaxID=2607531 RepID=A0A7E6ES51_9MOLL|nr:tyrosine-protein phosphatase non-receptor type 23 isoform X2 [Octopus sinensis]